MQGSACSALVAIVKPTPESAAKMLSAGAGGLIKWAMEATLIPQQGAVVSVQAVDRLPTVICDIVAIYIDERVVEMTASHQLWAHGTSIPTRVARKYAGNSPAYAKWSYSDPWRRNLQGNA